MNAGTLRGLCTSIGGWFLGSSLIGLLVWVRISYAGHLLSGGGVLFDAEGFARMCRVSRLFGTDVWVLGGNGYEGWPAGTGTGYSTLADYLLLWAGALVRWVGIWVEWLDERVGVILRTGAMDYGGGVFGVVVGGLVAGALWWWVRRQGWGRVRLGVWSALLATPPLVFSTRFGALDESVFAIAFLGWVLVLEDAGVYRVRAVGIITGILAGAATWVAPRVSVPFVLMVLIGRVIGGSSLRGALQAAVGLLVPFLGVMVVACLLDGDAWLGSLLGSRGQFSHHLWLPVEDLGAPLLWFGGLMLVPLLAFFGRVEDAGRSRWQRLVALSALLAMGASWLMPVWAPIAVLLTVVCGESARVGATRISQRLPGNMAVQGWLRRAVLAVVLIGGFWPMARWWEGWIFPTESRVAEAMEYREEMGQLRRIAHGIRGNEVQPFLAPWYLSPAISYWSMQPSVSRFTPFERGERDFATTFFAAEDVSIHRATVTSLGVRWVICDAPDRFERNVNRGGFGKDSSAEPAIRTLRRGRQVTEPLGYARVFTTGTFVVLEPLPAAAQRIP